MTNKDSGGTPKKRFGKTPDGSATGTTARRSRGILTKAAQAYAEMTQAALQNELTPAPDTSAGRGRRGKAKG